MVPAVAAPVMPVGGTLVQEILTPEEGEVSATAVVCPPEHIVLSVAEKITCGAGFTVII